jgi:hypothetical protein
MPEGDTEPLLGVSEALVTLKEPRPERPFARREQRIASAIDDVAHTCPASTIQTRGSPAPWVRCGKARRSNVGGVPATMLASSSKQVAANLPCGRTHGVSQHTSTSRQHIQLPSQRHEAAAAAAATATMLADLRAALHANLAWTLKGLQKRRVGWFIAKAQSVTDLGTTSLLSSSSSDTEASLADAVT